MSDTISTLIAFVGFLIVLSMLAQSVQEALKSVLKLKSGVWERFLLSLYQREFKVGGTKKIESTSFFQRVWSGEFVGDFDTRLKRLKDVVASADDLLQTVKRTLYDIATVTNENPASPNLSIPKQQELAAKLKELRGLKLDALLSIYDRLDANVIAGLTDALHTFDNTYPDLGYNIKQVEGAALAALRKDCEKLLAAITAAEKKVSDYRQQIECRFDAWIAQVNEEYRRNMLKWTVVTGFLLVLMFNADAFTIYKYLSANSQKQEKVLLQVQQMTPKVFRTNVDDLNSIDVLIVGGKADEAKKAMEVFSAKLEQDFKMFGANVEAKSAAELAKTLSAPKSAAENTEPVLLKELKNKEGELARMYAALHKTAISYQLEGMASLDLPLGWSNEGSMLRSPAGWDANYLFLTILGKLVGLLLTTFLITFGAPFWNDILTAVVGFKNSMKAKS